MATLGQKPATTHVSFQKQTITGNGGTSYTLQQSVGSELDIAVFVNNTRQEPTTAYTASGTSLVMTGAVNSSDSFYVMFLAKAINTTGLPVSAVNTASINALAITEAKIANGAVTVDKINFPTKTTMTGDGSDVTLTINSGRTVDDVLVFVNGICLVPTDDYTISGTTLTFVSAPSADAEIVVRYIG